MPKLLAAKKRHYLQLDGRWLQIARSLIMRIRARTDGQSRGQSVSPLSPLLKVTQLSRVRLRKLARDSVIELRLQILYNKKFRNKRGNSLGDLWHLVIMLNCVYPSN